MFKHLVRFSLLLFLVAGVTYGLHYWLYTTTEPEASLELINFAYKFNVGITFLFTSSMILASEHLKQQLGFIFMVTGVVKLGLLLYLLKSAGFEIDKSVFLHIFIPYVVCVMVEIIYVIKILNESNFSNDR